MPNKTKIEQFVLIKEALRQLPEGADIESIVQKTGIQVNKKTILRRLQELSRAGEVEVAGKARATRYRLVQLSVLTGLSNASIAQPATSLTLDEWADEVLALVTRPQSQRKPVAYQRAFIESYQPNVDAYLTIEEKQKLAAIGRINQFNYPAGTYAKQILSRLLIDLSWNSSRLEGNTYSLLDTEKLIVTGQEAENKSVTDAQMILNHKDAIEYLVNNVEATGFDRHTILSLHGLLSDNLLPDPSASGRLRNQAVGIYHSVYTPPAMPQLIEELFDILLQKINLITDPFEQAFFIMVHLPYLQPFDDVNKRVSRIAANIPLIRQNLSPLSFVDVPNDLYINGLLGVYELNRLDLLKSVFIWAYQRSAARYAAVRQSIGEPDVFKLRYRQQIRELIGDILRNGADINESTSRISFYVQQHIPEEDRAKFSEVVETELLSVHEGNFARFFISPSEFKKWKENWNRSLLRN